jgi:hypothetical protein
VTCDELIDNLMDYLDGVLVEEHQVLAKTHLDGCQNCTFYIESYSHTVKIARKLPRCGLPPDVEKRLRAALKKELCGDGGEAKSA